MNSVRQNISLPCPSSIFHTSLPFCAILFLIKSPLGMAGGLVISYNVPSLPAGKQKSRGKKNALTQGCRLTYSSLCSKDLSYKTNSFMLNIAKEQPLITRIAFTQRADRSYWGNIAHNTQQSNMKLKSPLNTSHDIKTSPHLPGEASFQGGLFSVQGMCL